MSNALPKVLSLGHRFSSLEIERTVLRGVADVVDGNAVQAAELGPLLAQASAVMLGTGAALRAETIRQMAACRLIVRYGVGVDNVDVAEATRRGITVANVPDYCVDEVSDHTVALLLAANRRLFAANKAALNGHWGTRVMQGAPRLAALSVGLVGFGRIGQEVARKVKPLVFGVLAYDPVMPPAEIEKAGVKAVDFNTLLQASDFVSIHCPLIKETQHLFNREAFEKMKPSAWLINTARGEIINEEALLEALQSEQIAGAALDVLAAEPPDPRAPLLGLRNLLLTPHVAFYSVHALWDLQRHAAEQVKAALTGGSPRWALN